MRDLIIKHIDKICHFFVSGWIFLIVHHLDCSIILSFLVAFYVGTLKELLDFWFYGKFDIKDILANTLGILISLLITLL